MLKNVQIIIDGDAQKNILLYVLKEVGYNADPYLPVGKLEVGCKIRVYIKEGMLDWDYIRNNHYIHFPEITINDIFNYKEKEIKTREVFSVSSEGLFERSNGFDSYKEAEDFIKKQGVGKFRIDKTFIREEE